MRSPSMSTWPYTPGGPPACGGESRRWPPQRRSRSATPKPHHSQGLSPRVTPTLCSGPFDLPPREARPYPGVMAVSRRRSAVAARRRKRRMDRVEHDLSEEQWTALKAAWGGCAYCGATDRPLQRDCVLALSRGGRYTLENIAPACSSCNATSATTKSPAGCGASALTNMASSSGTFRSRHRSLCDSPPRPTLAVLRRKRRRRSHLPNLPRVKSFPRRPLEGGPGTA